MELNYLREFVLLAQTCHYQNTAEQLYISQPSLSKHIHAMERELGAPLFIRSTRTVALSDFGRAFLPYAKRIVQAQEEYSSTLLRQLSWKNHRITVGISPLVTLHSLLPFLSDFSGRYPQYHIDILERDDVSLRKLLFSGGCTVIITAEDSRFDDSNFHATPYADDILVAVTSENHPLAQAQSVTVSDLQSQTILQLEQTELVSRLGKTAAPFSVQTVARQAILADLVCSGMGVGILTRNAARHILSPGLKIIPIVPAVSIRLNALTPAGIALPLPARELLTFLDKNCCNPAGNVLY